MRAAFGIQSDGHGDVPRVPAPLRKGTRPGGPERPTRVPGPGAQAGSSLSAGTGNTRSRRRGRTSPTSPGLFGSERGVPVLRRITEVLAGWRCSIPQARRTPAGKLPKRVCEPLVELPHGDVIGVDPSALGRCHGLRSPPSNACCEPDRWEAQVGQGDCRGRMRRPPSLIPVVAESPRNRRRSLPAVAGPRSGITGQRQRSLPVGRRSPACPRNSTHPSSLVAPVNDRADMCREGLGPLLRILEAAGNVRSLYPFVLEQRSD